MRRILTSKEEEEALGEVEVLRNEYLPRSIRNVPSLRPSWLLLKALDQIEEDRKEMSRLRKKCRELYDLTETRGEGRAGD